MLRVIENYYCIRGLYPSIARKLAQKVVLGDATATSKISPLSSPMIHTNNSNDDDSSLEGGSISSLPPMNANDECLPGAHGDTKRKKIRKKKEQKHKTTVDIALEKMEGTNMTFVCLC